MKLLVCVDIWFRPISVVNQAVEWAKKMGGKLDLVYVDQLPDGIGFIQEPTVRDVVMRDWHRARDLHRMRLESLLHLIPDEQRGQLHHLAGQATAKVLEIAPEFDVLVVATHQRKGLSRLWMGSVAERLVRTAAIPVLVVHLDADLVEPELEVPGT